MKEDVVAANLANLRQSINELKERINRLNVTSSQPEQHIKVDLDEKTIYNGVAKSFCTCWNDALSVIKKHVWKQQPDTLSFSLWFPKLVELFKQKSKFLEYIYSHVCDYNLNRLNIEINTENILKRQDEILAQINDLKHPITVIPPNINGLFIRGHHIKLRYVVAIVAIILMWTIVASVSSLKYKEESFAHYSMYRVAREQYRSFIEEWTVAQKDD
ncbi:hypothetical protein [Bacteroides zhangwenhongii]|uniref:hypothetical protein n=1 Tax=Bacteroides zhangwenhongii TaxID=2650157 RepID=UPI0022E42F52|nr:hypothetical protein [Bacteroides zhangwenhongii]